LCLGQVLWYGVGIYLFCWEGFWALEPADRPIGAPRAGPRRLDQLFTTGYAERQPYFCFLLRDHQCFRDDPARALGLLYPDAHGELCAAAGGFGQCPVRYLRGG